MTILPAIVRTAWLPSALCALCAATLFLAAGGNTLAAAAVPGISAFPLVWFFTRNKKPLNGGAAFIYAALVIQVLVGVMGIPFSETLIFVTLLIFPLVLLEYLFAAGRKSIPGSGAIIFMLSGFLISFGYQFVSAGGIYGHTFTFDMLFLLGCSVFFIIYILLARGIIQVRPTIIALSLSGCPLIAYVLLLYAASGEMDMLVKERFGFPVEIGPNAISSFLDVIFPLTLFLAITEKKRGMKMAFGMLSLVYCLCLLSTFSRGSMPGLIVILLYFVIRSKSIKTWIVIAVVTAIAGAGFGEKIVERFVSPNRLDMLSNQSRVEMLRSAYNLLKGNYFFFGIGMNNFSVEKFRYGFPRGFDRDRTMSSHNTFMEVWLGWGLMGLFGWLWLMAGGIVRLARSALPPETARYRLPFIFSLLSFMLHGLFDSIIANLPFLVLLFTLMACISFVVSRSAAGQETRAVPSAAGTY